MMKFGASKSGFTSKLKTETGNEFAKEEHALYANPQGRVSERAEMARERHDREITSRDPLSIFVADSYFTGSEPDRLYCNQSAKGDFIEYRRLIKLAQTDERVSPVLQKLSIHLEREAEGAINMREALMQLGVAMYHQQLGDSKRMEEHYSEFQKWLEGNKKAILVELQDKSANLGPSFGEHDPSAVEYGASALRRFQKLLGNTHSGTDQSFEGMRDIFATLANVTYFLEEAMIAEIAMAQPGFVKQAIK